MALVLTQPDRPAGRGLKLQASPVKQLAQQHAHRRRAAAQPEARRQVRRRRAAARAALEAARPDVMVVAAYGLILPPWVLALPRLGCLNIHASLLPRWRGAAPIQRAIEAGDAQTGITIMQMDAGLDTGDMLLAEAAADRRRRHHGTLHDKLAALGGRLIVAGARSRGLRRPRAAPPARGRRHLRAQDRQGRSAHRLASAGRADRAPHPRLRSAAGLPLRI